MRVKRLFWLVLLAFSAVLGQDSPLTNPNTCTPSSAGNSSIDDVPAISKALSTCGNGGTIIIPAGETFMIRSPLGFQNCSGCNFQIEGTLKVSDDLHYWRVKLPFSCYKTLLEQLFIRALDRERSMAMAKHTGIILPATKLIKDHCFYS